MSRSNRPGFKPTIDKDSQTKEGKSKFLFEARACLFSHFNSQLQQWRIQRTRRKSRTRRTRSRSPRRSRALLPPRPPLPWIPKSLVFSPTAYVTTRSRHPDRNVLTLFSLVPLSQSIPNSQLHPPEPPRRPTQTTKRKETTMTRNSRNLTTMSWTLLTQTRTPNQSPK